MEKGYVTRSKGATVTIFAPYDCNNNCPFCVNKKEYKLNPNFDLDKVLESIEELSAITPACDFVVTGGEPFADLEKLTKMTEKIISCSTDHRMFINTTLPTDKYTIDQFMEFFERYHEAIECINISRHLSGCVKGYEGENLQNIPVPVRFNCVLTASDINKESFKDDLWAFYEQYLGVDNKYPRSIQFRSDYTLRTTDNIFEYEKDEVFQTILEALKPHFEPNAEISGAEVNRWNVDLGKSMSYHSTLPYSRMETEESIIINDVIINPRGEILDDWNEYGSPLDLEKYRNADRSDEKINK